jgi:hypothetical protein
VAGGRETWRQITWAPDYAVSDHGRVMRLTAKGGTRPCKELKPCLTEKGYLRCALVADGEKVTARIHRLVCEAFHGPTPIDRPVVRHLDGNPANNHISNVVWGTPRENMADKYRHGTAVDPPGLAERRAQTHCHRGHQFTIENARTHGRRRICRACCALRSREYAMRKAG